LSTHRHKHAGQELSNIGDKSSMRNK